MTTNPQPQSPTTNEVLRAGKLRRRIALTAAIVVGALALTGAAAAMASTSDTTSHPAEAPGITTAPLSDNDRADAQKIMTANTLIAEQLDGIVEVQGLAGNSENIQQALDANDPLALAIAVSQTEHARTYVAGLLIVAIERDVALYPGSVEPGVQLLEVRNELDDAGSTALCGTDAGDIATRVADLYTALRG